MALFEERIDAATDYLERLSPRDRMLMMVIVVGVLVFVTFIGNFIVTSKLRSAIDERESLTNVLKGIQQNMRQFDYARQKNLRLEKQIRENGNVQLFSYLERKGKDYQIKIASMREVSPPTRPKKKTKIKEKAVRIELQQVGLANLAKFLDSIENSGKIVKVRQLELKPNFKTPGTPDVVALISTYVIQ